MGIRDRIHPVRIAGLTGSVPSLTRLRQVGRRKEPRRVAIHPMRVARIVDDPFTRAEAVEQESWLLEGEVVRISLRHINEPFNPYAIRVVVPAPRLEPGPYTPRKLPRNREVRYMDVRMNV